MNIKTLLILTFFGMGFLMISCGDDEPELTDCETTAYNDEVKTIINKSCNVSGCHDGGANSMRKPMTDFAEVLAIAGGRDKRAVDDKDMPPAASSFAALTAAEVETLMCWLENGKKEN